MNDRAIGCLAGLLLGDNLGALVEFMSPENIFERYSKGEFEIQDGGVWNLVAGQPTDDGEMALALANSIVVGGGYSVDSAKKAYIEWIESDPFDCGMTISQGLRFSPDDSSQANGAMMRVAPLGIYLAGQKQERIIELAKADAALTHPNLLCQDLNAVFVAMIAHAIESSCTAKDLYDFAISVAKQLATSEEIISLMNECSQCPPYEYVHQQGWVKIAFGNLIWQLCNASSFRDALNNTIRRGGDTDTNAAICGAIMGALNGASSIPKDWLSALENCKPDYGLPNVHQPRPKIYWPCDYQKLAVKLLKTGSSEVGV